MIAAHDLILNGVVYSAGDSVPKMSKAEAERLVGNGCLIREKATGPIKDETPDAADVAEPK